MSCSTVSIVLLGLLETCEPRSKECDRVSRVRAKLGGTKMYSYNIVVEHVEFSRLVS